MHRRDKTSASHFASIDSHGFDGIDELLHGATLERECTSSVTSGWKVAWSPHECARDMWANFFDANRSEIDRIAVDVDARAGAVRIFGPASMNLEQAYYLGSTKTKAGGDIGFFGEGFKAAGLCLLRDYGVALALTSDQRAVTIELGQPLSGLNLRPLVYRFYRLRKRCSGTQLFLKDVPAVVETAFSNAHTDFFSVNHPVLGDTIAGDADKVLIATTKNSKPGCIFYRNLRRAELSLPLVIVINKSYAALERLTARDRDRTAFGEQILTAFYRIVASCGVLDNHLTLKVVLRAIEGAWESGHPLLSAVLHRRMSFKLPELFGNAYFAASSSYYLSDDHLIQVRDIEANWEAAGRRRLPHYFAAVGARTALEEIENHLRRVREEAERELEAQRRGPTNAEQASIDLLERVFHELDSSLADVVLRDARYLIAKTEHILGAWQRSRAYRSQEIYLSAKLFVGPFRTAFATLLHEGSHNFGGDGSRNFTDRLTALIEAILFRPRRLRRYAKLWNSLRRQVSAERSANKPANSGESVDPPTQTVDSICEILESASLEVAGKAVSRYVHDRAAVLNRIMPHAAFVQQIVAVAAYSHPTKV